MLLKRSFVVVAVFCSSLAFADGVGLPSTNPRLDLPKFDAQNVSQDEAKSNALGQCNEALGKMTFDQIRYTTTVQVDCTQFKAQYDLSCEVSCIPLPTITKCESDFVGVNAVELSSELAGCLGVGSYQL
jgi:hypothetical protein